MTLHSAMTTLESLRLRRQGERRKHLERADYFKDDTTREGKAVAESCRSLAAFAAEDIEAITVVLQRVSPKSEAT